MTCSGEPGAVFEFITRPVTYPRQPFQLASGEFVQFESRFFSMSAYSLLADKRLFTLQESHPIPTGDVKLYINKDTALAPAIEPTIAGDEYLAGTPHYVDYVTDLRSLLVEVANLHAADSDWPAVQFFQEYMKLARATYSGDSDEVPFGDFVHPEPVNDVPSGFLDPQPRGDGLELGAQRLMDIDMDEVQYSPIIRPAKRASISIDTNTLPVQPVFPAVITPLGATPTLNDFDKNNYNQLALGVHASGAGLLITGDALVGGPQIRDTANPTPLDLTDPSLKLMKGSGQPGVDEGAYQEDIPWALYPAQKELCSYYTPLVAINTINASGRQAIFGIPTSELENNTVLLLNVSEAGSSGQLVSNYPANYHATSGIDANGHAHKGLHVCNKLIYPLGGQHAIGFSPVNGEKVFIHYYDSVTTSSKGRTWSQSGPQYQNGDNLFGRGVIVTPFDGGTSSIINWASNTNIFAPASWAELKTEALQPLVFFGNASVNFQTADIQAGSDRGVMSLKQYAQWGFIDTIVFPDKDRAQGGQRKTVTLSSTIHSYKEGIGDNGEFAWIELDDSPVTTTSDVVFFENTFGVNNIFAFFFDRRPNNGFVHVNGDIYVQWSIDTFFGGGSAVRNNLFAPIGESTTILTPSVARSDVIITIGFFPSWARRRYVTTNTQTNVPRNIDLSPAKSSTISFDSDLFATDDERTTFTSDISEFGQPVWDPDEEVNYIYFLWNDGVQSRLFFAHMNTSFVIFRINQVSEGDGFLFGRPALLSI